MDYEKFLAKEELKSVLKVVGVCALIFALTAFAAYSNTRSNGFGDIKPFNFYVDVIWQYISRSVELLSKFSGRFMH